MLSHGQTNCTGLRMNFARVRPQVHAFAWADELYRFEDEFRKVRQLNGFFAIAPVWVCKLYRF